MMAIVPFRAGWIQNDLLKMRCNCVCFCNLEINVGFLDGKDKLAFGLGSIQVIVPSVSESQLLAAKLRENNFAVYRNIKAGKRTECGNC
jgi:hypothetical protein